MRKIALLLVTLTFFILAITGCDNGIKTDNPVSMAELNTDSVYVARGFIESIYSDNRDMFYQCYPEGFIDAMNQAAATDVFEQYKGAMTISAKFVGTTAGTTTEYNVNNGFDEAAMKSYIAFITTFEYSDIEQIRIQQINVYYKSGDEIATTDFSYIVCKASGAWYLIESYNAGEVSA